jgi:hypothetical protein
LFAVESTVGDEQTDFRMAQYKSCWGIHGSNLTLDGIESLSSLSSSR